MIEIEDVLLGYIIVVIVIFIILQWLNITVWSSIVLAVLVALGIMFLLYPPTRLLSEKMCDSVFLYIGLVVVSVVVTITYAIVKCAIDSNDCYDYSAYNDFSFSKCVD